MLKPYRVYQNATYEIPLFSVHQYVMNLYVYTSRCSRRRFINRWYPVTKMLILPFLFLKNRKRVCHTLHFDKRFSSVDETAKSNFFDPYISLSKSISDRWSGPSTIEGLIKGHFKRVTDCINHSLAYQKIL